MNFFERQEAARRTSRRLLWLLVPAVIGIVLAANAAAAFAWVVFHTFWIGPWAWPGPFFFLTVSLATLWVIAMGTWDEILAISKGGAALADALGARALQDRAGDVAEMRLRNCVEEMAIAAGMPAPRVYVMDDERSINAFTAGFSPADAVLVATRGMLDALRRDELQGVVAHEFSHLLNGDTVLNMRLIGLLGGILRIWLLGQELLDREDASIRRQQDRGYKPKGNAAYVLLGGLLQAVGSLGSHMAGLIKAGISRQRELLADSCAVQYTRDADGIAGALVKLEQCAEQGRIHHWRAGQVSHMFFGDALEAKDDGRFATHPTVAERLANIYGRRVAVGEIVRRVAPPPAPKDAAVAGVTDLLSLAASVGTFTQPQIDFAASLLARIPATLRDALHDPDGAAQAMCALVLAPAGSARDAQVALLGAQSAAVLALRDQISSLGEGARLPLVELAIPALRALDTASRQGFVDRLHALIAADRRMTLEEFVLETILAGALAERGRPGGAQENAKLDALAPEARVLLSLTAHAAGADPARAFASGCAELGRTMELVPAQDLKLEGVQAAIARLRRLQPLQKPRLLKALARAALADGRLAVRELELLRAISATLDCPMPPLATA